jgi:predicted metal-binding membrane protein
MDAAMQPPFAGFETLWIAMMTVMMAPAALPMLRHYARLQPVGSRSRLVAGRVGAFSSGYLAIWAAFGLPVFVLLRAAPMNGIPPIAYGAALVTAGGFQFTPLKSHCLRLCRPPFSFFLHWWRDGARGAVAMGARHGVFCVGCCWALVAVWALLGMMNPWWMAIATLVIFAERVLPFGPRLSRWIGAGMVALGLVLAAGTAFPSI